MEKRQKPIPKREDSFRINSVTRSASTHRRRGRDWFDSRHKMHDN